MFTPVGFGSGAPGECDRRAVVHGEADAPGSGRAVARGRCPPRPERVHDQWCGERDRTADGGGEVGGEMPADESGLAGDDDLHVDDPTMTR